MNIIEFIIVIIIIFLLFSYLNNNEYFGPPYETPESAHAFDNPEVRKQCDKPISEYYYDRYSAKRYYQPSSYDAKNYKSLKEYNKSETLQTTWKKRINNATKDTYTDNKGNMYKVLHSDGIDTNADINNKYTYHKIDKDNTHEAMSNLDKHDEIDVDDLIPDPCINKHKDWTNMLSECENLIQGQNFVKTEDEHFTNKVIDTRNNKFINKDLRKSPAIEYTDMSVWNNKDTCKNYYNYLRPVEDGTC